MGQAKFRGNRDARMTEAKQRLEALKPDHIVCNNCQAKLTEIFTLDTHGMKGIEVAFSANCSTCNHDTWAVLGDPVAVADLHKAMEMEAGVKAKMGIAVTGKALR